MNKLSEPVGLRSPDGREAQLLSVNVHGELLGLMWRLTVRQVWRNVSGAPMAVRFAFPLGAEQTLLDLTVGRGETAQSVTQLQRVSRQRCHAMLGILNTGEQISIEWRVGQLLSLQGGSLRVPLPACLAPRAPHPMKFGIEVHDPVARGTVGSPTHELQRVRHANGMTLGLRRHTALDKDLVLTVHGLRDKGFAVASPSSLAPGSCTVLVSSHARLRQLPALACGAARWRCRLMPARWRARPLRRVEGWLFLRCSLVSLLGVRVAAADLSNLGLPLLDGGFTALRLLPALAAAANFMLLYAIARRLTGKELAATLATVCFFVPLLSSFTLRPQIFTFLCFSTYLLVLVEFKYARSTRLLWLLPVLMLAWVNLHGAFMLGIALLATFITCEWGNGWLFPVRHSRSTQPLGLLCTVMLATIAATLLNPQGLRILLYPFETVAMEASKGLIAEWQSPDFHQTLPRISLAGIFGWFIAAVYARRKPDLTELLLPLLMIVAGLSAWRHLPLTAIVLLAFFCAMLRHVRPSEILARSFWWRRRTRADDGKQVTPHRQAPFTC